MKKLVLAVFLTAMVACYSFGQGPTFGAKAGVNFANFTEIETSDFRISAHFGAVANIVFSEVFSLQPELLYSAQGYKDNFQGSKVVGKIDYFILPVLADFTVATGFSIQVGPQLGINIRNDIEVDNQENSMLFTEDVVIDGVIGLQYMFDPNFFGQIRFAQGLTDAILGGLSKNQVISVSVGFMFDNAATKEQD